MERTYSITFMINFQNFLLILKHNWKFLGDKNCISQKKRKNNNSLLAKHNNNNSLSDNEKSNLI